MSTKVNVFGAGVELPKDNLPSNSDVIRHVKLVESLNQKVLKDVAQDVISVWRTVSSVFCDPITIKDENVTQKIGRLLHKAYKCEAGLLKKAVKQSFLADSNKLFQFLHCDCDILLCAVAESGCKGCSKQAHLSIKCTHSAETKIPEPLLLFLRYLPFNFNCSLTQNYLFDANLISVLKEIDI